MVRVLRLKGGARLIGETPWQAGVRRCSHFSSCRYLALGHRPSWNGGSSGIRGGRPADRTSTTKHARDASW